MTSNLQAAFLEHMCKVRETIETANFQVEKPLEASYDVGACARVKFYSKRKRSMTPLLETQEEISLTSQQVIYLKDGNYMGSSLLRVKQRPKRLLSRCNTRILKTLGATSYASPR
jgi:hypothetical protein